MSMRFVHKYARMGSANYECPLGKLSRVTRNVDKYMKTSSLSLCMSLIGVCIAFVNAVAPHAPVANTIYPGYCVLKPVELSFN